MFDGKYACVVMLALLPLACVNPGKLTGGGQLFGDDGNRIANFGFNGDTCDGDLLNPTGHFNYVDQGADVRMNGELLAAGLCVTPDAWDGEWTASDCLLCEEQVGLPSYLAHFEYGEGEGLVCMQDNGEGQASGDDEMFVLVVSGPYAGYERHGTVQGNLQAHACEHHDDDGR